MISCVFFIIFINRDRDISKLRSSVLVSLLFFKIHSVDTETTLMVVIL